MHFTLLSTLVAVSTALGGLASPLGNSTKGQVSSIGKRFTDSRWTFYDVGLGACGETNVNSDYIVALNADQFGSGYPGPYCGKSITLTYGGKTATAKIMDRCPGCPYGGLDLSRGLFNYFASEDVGVLSGEWDFVGSSSESTTTTKAATTTSTSQKTTSTKAPATSSTPKATTSASQQRYIAAVNTKTTTTSTPASTTVHTASHSATHSAGSDAHTASQTATPSSTGFIASAVAAAASLPTGSATAEQMEEDMQLVGQIITQLGNFFDKYLAAQNKDSN